MTSVLLQHLTAKIFGPASLIPDPFSLPLHISLTNNAVPPPLSVVATTRI